MDKIEELRIIQNKEIQILKEFIRICDKYNLKYYLVEGSMLGAVRHHGMIPWDDDIDVAMLRNDYEKFLSVSSTEFQAPYKCLSYTIDEERKDYLTQIVDENTIVETGFRSSTQHTPIWIDLFVLDGMPKSQFRCRLHFYHLLYRKMILMWSDLDYFVVNRKNRPVFEKVLIGIGKVFHTKLFISTKRQLRKMDSCMKKIGIDNDNHIINFMSEYKGRSECPYDWFGDGKMVEFGDFSVRIPAKAEKLLEQLYGDYMKLPPESERYKHKMKLLKY